jgi:hypothetical protein
LRAETADQAAIIDQKIVNAWAGHPKRQFVESATHFVTRAARAIELIRSELPDCCQSHAVPEIEKGLE